MRKPIFKNGQSRLQQPLFSDLCSCLLMNTLEKVTRIWTLYCELACNHVANKSAVSIQILPQKSRHFAHEECSNEQGVSFHLSPFPSRFHSSRQCSSSPFSYRKLLGSPVFQFVNVTGRPVDIQKNTPSSAWSVPDVQKCSWPSPA